MGNACSAPQAVSNPTLGKVTPLAHAFDPTKYAKNVISTREELKKVVRSTGKNVLLYINSKEAESLRTCELLKKIEDKTPVKFYVIDILQVASSASRPHPAPEVQMFKNGVRNLKEDRDSSNGQPLLKILKHVVPKDVYADITGKTLPPAVTPGCVITWALLVLALCAAVGGVWMMTK
ncbi:hypothetical protein ADUPG1_013490 [Aduncisulcus paluster]|uniref:Uncharacterized protein n=1 Tax=Aduncisulcus paluster TaxID=2918883 RepID=A0ABQ5K562_9EUKA|nr:hypothetical protein ADUPG1_013490 [Aduncisulcus paluster]|eukprot:gnl/Carplike_NY0171/166_a242_5525.p2 GENE.gnl/Carplike_NY0171/166_a242_5525~~gnl/Carplike_NY0171/166_a242_5525.p2  ORF type:complete len:178 (+),score=59.10 gnl/Carplike_NY0171/166_a242_5525:50-583(+)